jgi:predicted transcriptional regulator
MSDAEGDVELDAILAVLENPIRRRILQKLSREMNYPLQLSKELNVSQQAIMKHLKVLEDNDFVVSIEERSDKGGPPRKVYVPRKRYCVRIDIGPNTYNEEFYSYREYNIRKSTGDAPPLSSETPVEIDGKVTGEMKNEVAGALPAFTDPLLENFRIKLEKALDVNDIDQKLRSLKNLISSLNKEIKLQEVRRRRLLAIRERAFEDVNLIISDISDDYLEKEILSLFVKDEMLNIEAISELLDTRRVYVEKVMEQIKKRLERS